MTLQSSHAIMATIRLPRVNPLPHGSSCTTRISFYENFHLSCIRITNIYSNSFRSEETALDTDLKGTTLIIE